MSEFYVAIDDTFTFSKTVSESDVYLFAGITGDLSPNHVDEEAMKKTPYGGRIAHGALLVGYMSACSTMACAASRSTSAETPVSLGYDRIRFLSGVLIGDTITVTYRIAEVDLVKRRSVAEIEVRKADGTLAVVASHILKWVAG